MTKVLFANTVEPHCGVHQFGVNLFNNLHSKEFAYFYDQPTCLADVQNYIDKENIHAVIVNWHPDIAGWPNEIEKIKGVKKVLSYHDWDAQEDKWDAIVFADPTMKDHGKWFSIPRPIPQFKIAKGEDYFLDAENLLKIEVGVHGFYGASANLVADAVSKEFFEADINVHCPVAAYGDKEGRLTRDTLNKCADVRDGFLKHGIKTIPDFRFLTTHQLIEKLSLNHINCYFRDTKAEWKGVSSALDIAVAAGRPIAINKCQAFRHLFHIEPSICIEDRGIRDILDSGTGPLEDYIAANSPEKLTEKVDDVMRRIL